MSRPRVSLVMNCYRQERLVGKAVQAALAQDYSPLEVIISDDCSPDGTWDAIREVAGRYRGPHAVVLNRNEQNLRSEHAEKLARMARGEYIVVAHGDDLSVPHRVSRLVAAWKRLGASMVTSNAMQIDEQDQARGLFVNRREDRRLGLDEIAGGAWTAELLGATLSFERRVYGPDFMPLTRAEISSGRDHILPLRAALMGGVAWLAEPLVLYRRHPGQGTTRIADWTGGARVWEETQRAHNMTLRMQMLREVLHLRRTRGDSDALQRAQALIVNHLVAEVDTWSRVRNALRADGLRPTWVDAAELDRRPIADPFQRPSDD